MQPRPTAARSVHLGYLSGSFSAFYNELIVEQTTLGSYFMACGFSGGYFGIQDKSTGRRALFSVWDAWKGDDPKAVPSNRQVEIVAQGYGVHIQRFGHEGTGAQCFFSLDWAVNETTRFLVAATVNGGRTEYAGYLCPQGLAWRHLATFSTPAGGRELTGLYSFIEDFRGDGRSVNEVRRATFGNVRARQSGGWLKAEQATFTASHSKKRVEAQDTIDAGIAGGRFYLQTGGATQQSTALNATIGDATDGTQPTDLPP